MENQTDVVQEPNTALEPLQLKTEKRKRNFDSADKVRAELNLEKWPAIWAPSKSKNKPVARTYEREITRPDGSRESSKLEVGFTQLGTLTTEDQRMLYALLRHWEDSGKPTGPVYFSDRMLQRLLKKKWGTNVIEAITSSLRRLRTTPLRWINSYHRAEEPGVQYVDETMFSLLDKLKMVTRLSDGHVTNQQGYFQFDENLLRNLLGRYTKPVFFDDLLKIETDIGQLLYTHLDLIMADKTRYERCTVELFYDLGLRSKSYRHASNRKQVLAKALKELVGLRINNGVIRSIEIQETKDSKDYKIVVQKGSVARQVELIEDDIKTQPVVINDYSKQKDRLQLQGEELVDQFYRKFHGVQKRTGYESRQVEQAVALIAQVGFDAAKYIVDFSFIVAQETKWKPATFGGILQYAPRGLDAFERSQAVAAKPAGRPDAIAREERETTKKDDDSAALLGSLSPEDYQRLYEQAKNEALQTRFLSERYAPGSPLVEGMIKSIILRNLRANNADSSSAKAIPAFKSAALTDSTMDDPEPIRIARQAPVLGELISEGAAERNQHPDISGTQEVEVAQAQLLDAAGIDGHEGTVTTNDGQVPSLALEMVTVTALVQDLAGPHPEAQLAATPTIEVGEQADHHENPAAPDAEIAT